MKENNTIRTGSMLTVERDEALTCIAIAERKAPEDTPQHFVEAYARVHALAADAVAKAILKVPEGMTPIQAFNDVYLGGPTDIELTDTLEYEREDGMATVYDVISDVYDEYIELCRKLTARESDAPWYYTLAKHLEQQTNTLKWNQRKI